MIKKGKKREIRRKRTRREMRKRRRAGKCKEKIERDRQADRQREKKRDEERERDDDERRSKRKKRFMCEEKKRDTGNKDINCIDVTMARAASKQLFFRHRHCLRYTVAHTQKRK